MLCDDESLEQAVEELKRRFPGVVKVQIGTEVWEATESSSSSALPETNQEQAP